MRVLKPIRVQMPPLKSLSDRCEATGLVCLVLLGFWCCLSRSSLVVFFCTFLLEWKCLFHTNVYLKHVTLCLLLEGLMVKRVHESRKVLWTFEQCWNFETTGTSEVRMDAFYITRWPGAYVE